MMQIKELFYTLQGEGAHAGRAAVFCRFAGCNLWSGRERDRSSAVCRFCDTDFVGTNGTGGGSYTPQTLAAAAWELWPTGSSRRLIVFTGGEPLLQLDAETLSALHGEAFTTAVETNGTIAPPPGIDWLCVSPKAGTTLVATAGQELKLVFPQIGAHPSGYEHLDFDRFSLQPMDGPRLTHNTGLAVNFCLEHPQWVLSQQTHKGLGLR